MRHKRQSRMRPLLKRAFPPLPWTKTKTVQTIGTKQSARKCRATTRAHRVSPADTTWESTNSVSLALAALERPPSPRVNNPSLHLQHTQHCSLYSPASPAAADAAQAPSITWCSLPRHFNTHHDERRPRKKKPTPAPKHCQMTHSQIRQSMPTTLPRSNGTRRHNNAPTLLSATMPSPPFLGGKTGIKNERHLHRHRNANRVTGSHLGFFRTEHRTNRNPTSDR